MNVPGLGPPPLSTTISIAPNASLTPATSLAIDAASVRSTSKARASVAPAFFGLFGNVLEPVAAACGDRERDALGRKRERDRFTDAGARAGNERNAPANSKIHSLSF